MDRSWQSESADKLFVILDSAVQHGTRKHAPSELFCWQCPSAKAAIVVQLCATLRSHLLGTCRCLLLIYFRTHHMWLFLNEYVHQTLIFLLWQWQCNSIHVCGILHPSMFVISILEHEWVIIWVHIELHLRTMLYSFCHLWNRNRTWYLHWEAHISCKRFTRNKRYMVCIQCPFGHLWPCKADWRCSIGSNTSTYRLMGQGSNVTIWLLQ